MTTVSPDVGPEAGDTESTTGVGEPYWTVKEDVTASKAVGHETMAVPPVFSRYTGV